MKTKFLPSWLSPQFIFGIVIIALGIMFLADNFGYIEARDFIHTYWPLLIILWGIAKVMQSPGSPGRTFGVILIFFGVMWQLDNLDIIYFRWHEWWPVILIIIGINFLRGSWFRNRLKPSSPYSETQTGSSENYLKHFVLMSGVKRAVTTKSFQGGELTAVMGGIDIDLRDAQMEGNEAVADIFTTWGGIQLRVPAQWTVVVRANPIMGGVEDKTYPPKEGEVKRLIIVGNVIMGGVEIKN